VEHSNVEHWNHQVTQSIRQSVQNGQFLSRLAEHSPDLVIAPHAD
jgi:hypothetical protein